MRSLAEIVTQLKNCNYTCEAGPLVNNVYFAELALIAGVDLFNSRDQLSRKVVISEAKKDIKELLARNRNLKTYELTVIKKGTHIIVLASSKGDYFGRRTFTGSASCSSEDCFNLYIGFAIALRRALGLYVPEKYLNAPAPTHPEINDLVEYLNPLNGKLRTDYLEEEGSRKGISPLSMAAKHIERIVDDSKVSFEKFCEEFGL
ncbi:hypothetical protein F373_gp213 [Bacillus phage SP-10]|uniref:hypothetical protein n=1 Tax=Bacillus phage SP10 TaxID=941058 RepID=UPI0002198BA9|nr:hypothetical protein F373_gp213 [Bacillus phage SP-10]BAK53025.1 hypothetical protein [Bacillus phage SP-10]